jgi:hypothetical protein
MLAAQSALLGWKLADRPSTELRKSAPTLPPQMSAVLFWPIFPNVAGTPFSNGLVVGKRTRDSFGREDVQALGDFRTSELRQT